MTVAVCLLAAATAARAQEGVPLADTTERALAKNHAIHAIRIERDKVDAADARARGALGAYDVQLKVEISGRHHRDPVNSLFSGAPAGRPAPSPNTFGSTIVFRFKKTAA